MPVFLRGRRAFCIIPAPPTSPRPTLIQSTVSPIRAVPTRTAPIRAAPVRASPTHAVPAPLPPPVTPTLPRLPRCRRLRIPKRRTARTSPARSEQPHDPRPFSHPAQGSATARVPFAVLPGAPVPAPEAQKKGGRNRTEARPPPKSNQSVAAASPRQLFNPSGQCTRLKQTRSV